MSDDINRALEHFSESLDDLVNARTGAIADIRDLQTVSRVSMQREAVRIEKRFGAEHPRTLRVKSGLSANETVLRAMEVERELVSVRVNKAAEGELLVQGRVAVEGGRGLPGLTVALADEEGKAIRGLETGRTDKAGHFALRVDAELLKKLGKAYPDGAYISVSAGKGTPLHREEKPIKFEPGAARFVEVTLKRGDFRPTVSRERPLRPTRAAKKPAPSKKPDGARGKATKVVKKPSAKKKSPTPRGRKKPGGE